ncbi:hypothetical protein R1flu_014752 [Riccia fluitans]|uniref:Uncharacterized protein n=1 Tax=Riccia fluitans TaxID=41844 RepID=A0ABD1YHE2_9MARC
MFSSQTPLPPLARQPQTPLFHALPASGHASSREEDEEEEVPYHPDPLPLPQAEPLPFRERLPPPSPPREETMLPVEQRTEEPPPVAPTHPMSTVLALSAQAPVSPDLKVMENGSSGATGEGDADAEEDKKREREHKKRSKNWTRYKEVRDGVKDREDNPFYDELHPLLSGKSLKRERERDKDTFGSGGKEGVGRDYSKELSRELAGDGFNRDADKDGLYKSVPRGRDSFKDEEEDGDDAEAKAPSRKKKRGPKYITKVERFGTSLEQKFQLTVALLLHMEISPRLMIYWHGRYSGSLNFPKSPFVEVGCKAG